MKPVAGWIRRAPVKHAVPIAIAMVLVFAVAGATGAIPDSSDGEVHLCYLINQPIGSQYNNLRVIDPKSTWS